MEHLLVPGSGWLQGHIQQSLEVHRARAANALTCSSRSVSDEGFCLITFTRRMTYAVSHAANELLHSSQQEGFVFAQRCPPRGPPPASQAATQRCSKLPGGQTRDVLGTAAAPCMGASRHTARKGSGWLGRACARGFEVTTCVSRSASLVPSPFHLSRCVSHSGTLSYASCSSDHQWLSQITHKAPCRGLSCRLGSTPSCGRCMLLVWPGTCLD